MLIFLFLLTLPAHAHADDDCSANFEDVHSPLAATLPKLSAEKRDEKKRIVSQTARLSSGERVKYQAGGCAHFAFSYEYGGAKFNPARVPSVFAAAEKLLRNTPVAKQPENKELLLKALAEGAKKPEMQENKIYKLPCGDANCVLDFHEKKQIKISYDMAL